MAGFYIHIPFCKYKCSYCNFHFSTIINQKNEMVSALIQEIVLQKDFLSGEKIETIYFGGGTPSILNCKEISQLLDTITKYYNISKNVEITLEANPDDLSKEKLQILHIIGINRLSIGIQSFFDKDLQFMKRIHTSLQAEQCIIQAQEIGFFNLNIDLIYGTPTMTDRIWIKNIKKAISFNVTHISAYALTIEPKTELNYLIQSKKINSLNEEKQVHQYILLTDIITIAGFIQYEISNFGKTGFFSKHNINYWKKIPYLGIGPSAHSFNGSIRQWNVYNNLQYIKALKQGVIPFKKEILFTKNHYNEYIMTRIRTIWGISLKTVKILYGIKYYHYLLNEADFYLKKNFLFKKKSYLLLSKKYWIYADGIANSLFFI